MLLETSRLLLREMTEADREDLCCILQDPKVMYAYEHAFSDAEVDAWMENNRKRYLEPGLGLMAVVRKTDGRMIGNCGLTRQMWQTKQVIEIGYLFARAVWHQGYAIEAADACKRYAFDTLKLQEVFSIIRDSNAASIRVATRNGMCQRGSFVKQYYGMDMPHLVFSVKNPNA